MAHIFNHKKKIVTRIRKIKGQLDAVERGLEKDSDCFAILQTVAACRGAINGLMNELVEEHIKEHVMNNPNDPKTTQDQAALELIQLLKTYWK